MVEEITPERLNERLDAGEEIQVVDIRTEVEYGRGHIPGAENVPFDRFARAVGERDWENEIVVACPKGESSLQAARLLESYEGVADDAWIANLEGGYSDWEYDLEAGPC